MDVYCLKWCEWERKKTLVLCTFAFALSFADLLCRIRSKHEGNLSTTKHKNPETAFQAFSY